MSEREPSRAHDPPPLLKATIALTFALICIATGVISAQAYVTEPATIWRIAGNGLQCVPTDPCGDGGAATAANINIPQGVALDAAGNLYIAERDDGKVRKVTPGGTISTFAGNGITCNPGTAACGDGGAATAANLANPNDVAVDGAGNVYIADRGANKIRKVTPAGVISTFAGNGIQCAAPTGTCGDGPTATAANISAEGVAVDGAGNVYIADVLKIRKVTPAGAISTIAGDGNPCAVPTGTCGDGPTATAAQLSSAHGVAVDGFGNVYIGDRGIDKVRKVTPAGAISTIAGDGNPCAVPTGTCGDGPTATAAQFREPEHVAVDGAGNVYIADEDNHKIRKVTPAGAISTIAGNGTACLNPPNCGDGGAATAAQLNYPFGVEVDAAGQNVFVADSENNEVRWIAGPQAGPTGPPGPPGAAGPQGPPGKNATVSCKVKKTKRGKVKVKCKVAQAASRSVLSYRLTRGQRVFAAGHRPVNNGKSVATLRARRAIKRGAYTLTLVLDSGGQTVFSRQTVRVR